MLLTGSHFLLGFSLSPLASSASRSALSSASNAKASEKSTSAGLTSLVLYHNYFYLNSIVSTFDSQIIFSPLPEGS